jgi:hypothetical protein
MMVTSKVVHSSGGSPYETNYFSEDLSFLKKQEKTLVICVRNESVKIIGSLQFHCPLPPLFEVVQASAL